MRNGLFSAIYGQAACKVQAMTDKLYGKNTVTFKYEISKSNHRRTQNNQINKFVCGGGWLAGPFAAG